MRVVISAGGTGGHIYPAIAIINKIKECEPNSEFLYIGTHNRMEKDLIPSLGIPYREKNISIISIAIDAPQDIISALSGKIGKLSGVSVKTAYSNVISNE